MPSETFQTSVFQFTSVDHAVAQAPFEATVEYSFGGGRPGPVALFVTWSPMLEAVSQRLEKLPGLPWMWGHLLLISLDNLNEDWVAEVAQKQPNRTFDGILVMSEPAADIVEESGIDANYWAVLRMCADLGMIQGRGVRT